jgi:hypothetical protein
VTTSQNDNSPQRQSDQLNADRYEEAATRLRLLARFFEAAMDDVHHDPHLHTSSKTVMHHLRSVYDTEVAFFTEQADQADVLAAEYRALATA